MPSLPGLVAVRLEISAKIKIQPILRINLLGLAAVWPEMSLVIFGIQAYILSGTVQTVQQGRGISTRCVGASDSGGFGG
jgi:hypothetical protein